jgi:hypothetical protein
MPETTGMTLDQIRVFTRQAASKVGAAAMDRTLRVGRRQLALLAQCRNPSNSMADRALPETPPRGGTSTPPTPSPSCLHFIKERHGRLGHPSRPVEPRGFAIIRSRIPCGKR